MSTLLDLKNEVVFACGGRDDTDFLEAIERGINAGLLTASLLFEPPELRVSGSLTAPSTDTKVSLTGLTRPWRIEEVFNESSAEALFKLPFWALNTTWLPSSGSVQFWALYGQVLHYRPQPDSNETLTVYYLQYPDQLGADSDEFPFSASLEGFTLAFAKEWAFGVLEEKESSDLWAGIVTALGVPEATSAEVRRLLREEWKFGNNVQGTLSKGSSQAG